MGERMNKVDISDILPVKEEEVEQPQETYEEVITPDEKKSQKKGGEKKMVDEEKQLYECCECHKTFDQKYKYCPFCSTELTWSK